MCENGGKALVPNEDIKKILLTIDEVKSWQSEIEKVALGEKIREVISQIRAELKLKNEEKGRDEKEKFYVSDRRWKKILKLLKTSAFLCGRNEVDLMDCQLITYCIWNTAKQREDVKKIVEEIVQQHGLEATTAIDDIEAQIKRFGKEIDSTFYKMSEKVTHEEPVTKRDSDNRIYYKLQKNDKGIGYVSKNVTDLNDYYGRNYKRHYYYDENFKNQRTVDYIEIYENQFTVTNTNYNYTLNIETKTIVDDEGGLIRDSVLFNNAIAYNSTKNSFDEKHYAPIADAISKELEKLEEFRVACEKPYDENLFADHAFKEVIMSEINKANKNLEDAEVKLKEQQNRYAQ